MLPAVLALLLLWSPLQNERVEYLISQLTQHGFSLREAEALLHDPRLKVYPPRTVQPREVQWDQVIARLVAPESVRQGSRFLIQHQESLSRAEKEFGLEREVLAAIVRVESNFGQNAGRYITFNVFYTSLLRSAEEKRWKWAAENLVSLAAYCKAAGIDCFRIRGSYAGALGPAQFLPRSLQEHGYDGNGDNLVDPFDIEDALFSAANFLIQNGWREDPLGALGKYYGSAAGYPRAVLAYAEALGMPSR